MIEDPIKVLYYYTLEWCIIDQIYFRAKLTVEAAGILQIRLLR